MGLFNTVNQLTQAPASNTSGGMPASMQNYLASYGVHGPSDMTWHDGALSDDLSNADRADMWGGQKIVPGNSSGVVQNIGQGWQTPSGNILQAGSSVRDGDKSYIINQSQDGNNTAKFGAYQHAPDLGLKDLAQVVMSVYGMGMGMAGIGNLIGGAMGGVGGLGSIEGLSGMDLAADGAMPGFGNTPGVGFGGAAMADGVNGMDFNSDLATRTGVVPDGSVNSGISTAGSGGLDLNQIKQVYNTGKQAMGQFTGGGTGSAGAGAGTVTGGQPQSTGTGGNVPITTGTTGAGAGAGAGTGGANTGQSSDLGNLLGVGGGLWDMNNQNQASDDMLNYLHQRQTMNDNMYNPGTPEYNALWDQMSRKDAAAGRNSQYGPRSVDLAARVAQLKMDANTKMTTGIGNYMANALNQRAAAPGGLLAGLQNGGAAGLQGLISRLTGGTSGGGNLSPGNTGGTATSGSNGAGPSNGEGYDGENGVNYGDGTNPSDWGPDWSDGSTPMDWGPSFNDWDNYNFGDGGDFGISF